MVWMEPKLVERLDVYEDENELFSVKLGDLARSQNIKPDILWRDNYYLFRKMLEDKIRQDSWSFQVLLSLKMMVFFWMDRNGNEIDEDEEKTGFRVNGQPEKNLGDWNDIFIPILFAKEIDEKNLLKGFDVD